MACKRAMLTNHQTPPKIKMRPYWQSKPRRLREPARCQATSCCDILEQGVSSPYRLQRTFVRWRTATKRRPSAFPLIHEESPMIHSHQNDEACVHASDRELDKLRAEIAGMTPALIAFAHRFFHKNSDIEDLVQETVFRSLRSLDCFTPGTSMKSWLFTIMRNTFCTRYKLARRERVGLPVNVQERMSSPATQDWTLQHEDVMAAVAELDADQRQALMLVAEGTSYAEAAEICNCKIGTIKSRVNRAREALRRTLD